MPLKIVVAAASKESTEFHNTQLLQGALSKPLVQVMDSVIHEGPNGEYMCIVLELLGPSVGKVMSLYTREEDDTPSPSLVQIP